MEGMKGWLTVIALLLVNHGSGAQSTNVKTLSFDTVYHAGINPAGELFVASSQAITRFDKDGKVLNKLPLADVKQITSFDAWHLTQLILYYRDQQRIDIYNHQLELRTSFVIDSVFGIEPWLVAASFDQKTFWVYDKADNSLKRFNRATGEISVDVICQSITSSASVIYLREYQRFLFFQTRDHTEVFNALGKSIQRIESGNKPLTFYGEEIVIIHDNMLEYIDLFTKEKRAQSIPTSYKQVLITDERMFGITDNSIDILPVK
jgi:hypothetical protein